MTLQNLQAEFLEQLFSENEAKSSVYPLSRLAIHRNNIITQLTNVLRETYPLVNKLLGSDFFNMTAKHYIEQYPSRHPCLQHYGEFFSNFLTEFAPVRNLVYLPEVAAFEWHCHQVFYAAEHPGLDKTMLASVPPEKYDQLHFSLHPAARLFQSHFPLLKIIDLCEKKIEEEINYNQGGVNLLIKRSEFDIKLLELTDAEFAFLSALNESQSLSTALDEARLHDPAFDLQIRLPEWIQNKTIVDYYISEL